MKDERRALKAFPCSSSESISNTKILEDARVFDCSLGRLLAASPATQGAGEGGGGPEFTFKAFFPHQ